MRGYTPYLLRVNVYIHATDSDNPRRLYTAKLVKRILIDGSAGGAVNLEEAFRPSSAPKLVHITPLYSDVGGKTKLVYYTDMLDNGRYYFFVGGVYLSKAVSQGAIGLRDNRCACERFTSNIYGREEVLRISAIN